MDDARGYRGEGAGKCKEKLARGERNCSEHRAAYVCEKQLEKGDRGNDRDKNGVFAEPYFQASVKPSLSSTDFNQASAVDSVTIFSRRLPPYSL